jgi:hypothetical protein
MAMVHHRWLAPLVFITIFIVLYCTAMPLLDDPDVPWHLATGHLIWDTHRLPTTDPWSFTARGAPWYILSWGWDWLIAGVERIGGAFGVFVFTVALMAGLLASVAAGLLRRGIGISAVTLTMLLAGLAMLEFTSARPHLPGYALAVAFQAILHRSRKRNGYGGLWALPPLMLLWVNMHGSFIAGITLLGAYGTEALFTKNYSWMRRLLVISSLCGAAMLVNPYQAGVITGAMRSLDSVAKAYIVEWKPMVFGQSIGLSAWLAVFILASNLRCAKAFPADKLLALAWLLAYFNATRNGALFVLLSAPYMAACLDEQTKGLRQETPGSALTAWLGRQRVGALWAGCAALAVAFTAAAAVLPHERRLHSDSMAIDDVVAYAQTHEPQRRFLIDYKLASIVIYRTHGALPVFVDSRIGVAYSEQVLGDYIAYMDLQPGWQQRVAAYGVNGIITAKRSPFSTAYAKGGYPQWRLAFSGANADLYLPAR